MTVVVACGTHHARFGMTGCRSLRHFVPTLLGTVFGVVVGPRFLARVVMILVVYQIRAGRCSGCTRPRRSSNADRLPGDKSVLPTGGSRHQAQHYAAAGQDSPGPASPRGTQGGNAFHHQTPRTRVLDRWIGRDRELTARHLCPLSCSPARHGRHRDQTRNGAGATPSRRSGAMDRPG